MADLVHDPGAADVLFDQPGVPFVILDHDDVDGLLRVHCGLS
jgi:hypothetical protein